MVGTQDHTARHTETDNAKTTRHANHNERNIATQSTPNTFLVQVLIFGSSVAHPAAVEQEDALHRRRFCRLPDSMDFLHFASACSLLLFMWISLSLDVCQSVEASFMRRLGLRVGLSARTFGMMDLMKSV